MRHVRRLIAILIGCATWCMVATTVAYAAMLHDPISTDSVVVAPNGAAAGPTFWASAATLALGVLLVVGVVGLVFALRHSRRTEHSPSSGPAVRA
jgi:hypothetical protein